MLRQFKVNKCTSIHPFIFFSSPARTQQAENWGVDDKERPQTSLELLHNGMTSILLRILLKNTLLSFASAVSPDSHSWWQLYTKNEATFVLKRLAQNSWDMLKWSFTWFSKKLLRSDRYIFHILEWQLMLDHYYKNFLSQSFQQHSRLWVFVLHRKEDRCIL